MFIIIVKFIIALRIFKRVNKITTKFRKAVNIFKFCFNKYILNSKYIRIERGYYPSQVFLLE
jgi:hypothetical protein